MPKPTRRERRKLAEKGKLAPRRAVPGVVEHQTPRPAVSPVGLAGGAAKSMTASDEPALAPESQEYAYVKSDLLRISVLAMVMVGVMVVLRFVLPQ